MGSNNVIHAYCYLEKKHMKTNIKWKIKESDTE